MDSTTQQPETITMDNLAATLRTAGPLAAADQLCEQLRSSGDYHNLFYAILLRKRVELGVSPFPTGASTELPAETHEPYEQAIREAARHVGNLYLTNRDIPRAWGFFRLIAEPQPVKDAIAAYVPTADEDVYPIVEIAWHQQLLPQKGFDFFLARQGICSAITMVSSTDLSSDPAVRNHCVAQLAKALHEQLLERLGNDLSNRGLPIADNFSGLLRDELFTEDAYHIDVSHLSSVVQMALQLPATETGTLLLARDLCAYGQRLALQYRGDADTPFEATYSDYAIYIDVLLGREVDAGLAHFQAKIARELEEGNTFPAEVLVNLLVKIGRTQEALGVARTAFANLSDDRGLSCPSVGELARQMGDFAALAHAAKTRGDSVTYLAGMIAAKGLTQAPSP
jgi:hypothetical protein